MSIHSEAMGAMIAFVILLVILVCAPQTRKATMTAIPWLAIFGGGLLVGSMYARSRGPGGSRSVNGGGEAPAGIMASVVVK